MKKKISLGLLAAAILAVVFVFANNGSKKAATCPDRPGCICSKAATEQPAAKPTAASDAKEKCPSTDRCVCK